MKTLIVSIVLFVLLGLGIWFPWPSYLDKLENRNKTEVVQSPQECPVCPEIQPCKCEPQTIIKEVPVDKVVIKEVIKEVPVEKIVYRDKVIYQVSDQDCRLELLACKNVREELFLTYVQTNNALNSCKATTTDFRASYQNLLYQFQTLIDLTFGLNRDYLFQPALSLRLNDFIEVASTSRAFLNSK